MKHTTHAITTTSTRKPKVLLIGWDSADWKSINNLLEEGRMDGIQNLNDDGDAFTNQHTK